jgi:hypothetical protein
MHLTQQNSVGAVRRRGHPPAAVALLIIVAGISVLSADASASGALPVSPTGLGSSAANNSLQVRPSTITYTGDGTGYLGGPSARMANVGIRWANWTPHLAVGTGFNQLNNCDPSCARGTFRGYPVKIELWRPQKLSGTLVFTRMTIFYKKNPPRGEPRHYTFTDEYIRGFGYRWWPPGAQSYCINTFGQKPDAACKNIHSLP